MVCCNVRMTERYSRLSVLGEGVEELVAEGLFLNDGYYDRLQHKN